MATLRKTLALLAVLFLAFASAQADRGAGTTTGNFLKLGVGARGVAMGNTQVAAVEDATALYWNPAALDKLNQKEVSFMHNQYWLGVTHDVLNYAQPTEEWGTFGAGMSVLNVADVAGYDKTGAATGNVAVRDTLMTVGWGKKWDTLKFPGVYTGMNVKMLQKTLGNRTATALLGDFGMYYQVRGRWLRGLETGLAVQNVSNGIQFVSEKEPLPRTVKAGAAYPIFGDSVLVAADVVQARGEKTGVNVGVDYRLWEVLSFRVGYAGEKSAGGGVAYGMGFRRGNLSVDYAMVPAGDLGDTHRVSLGYRFGGAVKQARVETQVEKAYGEALASYAQGYLVDAYMKAAAVVEVAPWHKASQGLMERVQGELKDLEGQARKSEFEGQIEQHYERGVTHFDKDEMVQAKREFEVILTLMPDHEGAKGYLARIGERFRNMAGNFYEVGMKQFAEGQYAEAKDNFQKVLVMDPTHAEAKGMIAKTEALLAEAADQAAAKEKAEKARGLFQGAVGDVEAKKYEEALKKLEEALRLAPEMAEAKRYRALCGERLAKGAFDGGMKAMQAGNWSEAIGGFRRAVALKGGEYPEAQKLLEKLQAKQGEQRKAESIQLYKQGLETLLTGDKEKTRALWQKAAEIWPENLDAKRGLERLSTGRGNGR